MAKQIAEFSGIEEIIHFIRGKKAILDSGPSEPRREIGFHMHERSVRYRIRKPALNDRF